MKCVKDQGVKGLGFLKSSYNCLPERTQHLSQGKEMRTQRKTETKHTPGALATVTQIVNRLWRGKSDVFSLEPG